MNELVNEEESESEFRESEKVCVSKNQDDVKSANQSTSKKTRQMESID